MQRKLTKQSPGACAGSKALMCWIKERGICAACGNSGGVIAHHFCGSSVKVMVGFERAMIGHWAINGLCQSCDDIVTHGTRKHFREIYGNERDVWLDQVKDYHGYIPEIIKRGIGLCGK